jgi:hypothetical protein
MFFMQAPVLSLSQTTLHTVIATQIELTITTKLHGQEAASLN